MIKHVESAQLPKQQVMQNTWPARQVFWHVLLLGSLVFSQPLFKTLGSQPEFLLAHNLDGLKLVWWICMVGFLPGLVVASVVFTLMRAFKPVEKWIASGSLFILISAYFFTVVSKSMGYDYIWPAIISCLLASMTLVLYAKSIFLRTFFSFAAFMVIVIPVIFSVGTDVRQLLIAPGDAGETVNTAAINKQPIVLILLDELPVLSLLDNQGKINHHRYPNFAEFSGRSTWYKYATTVAEATLNAVPPILTGKLTGTSGTKLPLAANYPENLFTLLSSSHEINAFETFTQLCPETLCKGARPDWGLILEDTLVIYAHIALPDQLKQNLPPIDTKWAGFLRDKVEQRNLHNDEDLHPHHRYKVRLDKFNQFMYELEYTDPVSLNYLHILMPHSPWMYLPDGRIYTQTELQSFTGTLPPGAKGADQTSKLFSQQHLMDHATQRHLLQLGYVDKMLGDVFSLLEDRNMFDDALIIVMADHGVSFKPGESLREANESSYQDILSVPLLIKYPGQKEAKIDLRAARTVDVLPTILDALDSEFENPGFDGRSLLDHEVDETLRAPALSLQRDTGEILSFDFSKFKDRFENSVKSRRKSLAEDNFSRIYALNDLGLLDKAVEQLPMAEPADFTLMLDNEHLYADINQERNNIPALIRASYSTQSRSFEKATVAVAVNGMIRGVSTLQRVEGASLDFRLVVAPDSFVNGSNSIRFYQVNGTSEDFSLSPVQFESKELAGLIVGGDMPISLSLDSQRIPVSTSGGYGELAIVTDDKTNQIRLAGWAADSRDGQVATEVFLFSGNRLVTSVKPSSHYPKAKEITGFASAEYSGFNVIMPPEIHEDPEHGLLTAIAVFDSGASPVAGELHYFNYVEHLIKTRGINRDKASLQEDSNKPSIEFAREYDFSDPAQALLFAGTGWSNASSGGARWNLKNKASLKFRVTNNKSPLDLLVQSSPFFARGKHETQTIEALLPSGSKQVIKLQLGQTDGSFIIHIKPEDIGSDGWVAINLEFLNAASPKSLMVNNDPRSLAIKVQTLQVLVNGNVPD